MTGLVVVSSLKLLHARARGGESYPTVVSLQSGAFIGETQIPAARNSWHAQNLLGINHQHLCLTATTSSISDFQTSCTCLSRSERRLYTLGLRGCHRDRQSSHPWPLGALADRGLLLVPVIPSTSPQLPIHQPNHG